MRFCLYQWPVTETGLFYANDDDAGDECFDNCVGKHGNVISIDFDKAFDKYFMKGWPKVASMWD